MASNKDETPAREDFCYITTTGRVSGRPHTIEIWFALDGRTLYTLHGAGHASDTVRNALRAPDVAVRIATTTMRGHARLASSAEEDALARRLLLAKYAPGYDGDLRDWGRDTLPLALDLADSTS